VNGVTWRAGDVLRLRAHTSGPGAGLSYPACFVTATEPGTAGGWDVFDATDYNGDELSFYGFSVAANFGGAQ
jgi:hypothetical protein